MCYIQTAGGRGHEYNVIAMLKCLLQQQPPADPTKPVQVKFSFDGGTVTRCKRRQQEHGTIQIMNGLDVRQAKSPKTSHQWMLYLGDEDYEVMKEELAHSLPDIESLHTNPKVNYKSHKQN